MNKCLKPKQQLKLQKILNQQHNGNKSNNIIKRQILPNPQINTISNRSSREKIKVFDVFQQNTRNKSRSTHEKPINMSKDIIVKPLPSASRQNSIELKKKSQFFEQPPKTDRLEQTITKRRSVSYLPPRPKLFKENDNSISYIQHAEQPQKLQQRRIKINVSRIKDENVLDLLLLNTAELKQKIRNYRCNTSQIYIRPEKFPKDFFN